MQTEDCPCPKKCERCGRCQECREYHKGRLPYCERPKRSFWELFRRK